MWTAALLLVVVALLSSSSSLVSGEIDPVGDRSIIHLRSDVIRTREQTDLFGQVGGSGGGVLQTVRKRFGGRPSGFDSIGERKLVLVHTSRILRAEERDALQATVPAVKFEHYLPHDTWIELLTGEEAAQLMARDEVDWIGPLSAEQKVAGQVADVLTRSDVESLLPACEIVAFVVFETEQEFETARTELVEKLRALALPSMSDAKRAAKERIYFQVGELSVAQMQALLLVIGAHPRVLRLERLLKHGTMNKYASWITQSGKVEERPIWKKGLRGEGQIVGCADTGLDYDHCFFNDDTGTTFGPTRETQPNHRKVIGYFSVDGADYLDEVGGHGTHVVGSIAGNAIAVGDSQAQNIIAEYNGQAPLAKIVFNDIGASDGSLRVNSAALGETVLQKAYDLGARIHTNSWGCSGGPDRCNTYDEGAAAVDKFVWDNRDMLVLFAAGNDGANGQAATQTVGSPATAKSAFVIGAQQSSFESFKSSVEFYDWRERREAAEKQLGVSSLDCCNPPAGSNEHAIKRYCCQDTIRDDIISMGEKRHSERNVAEFSSRGPTFDGRIKPDVMAPGQNIVSAHSDGKPTSKQCGIEVPMLGNRAARLSMQGTSMATPTAAGNAAQVRQYFTEGWYPAGRKEPSNARVPSGALLKAMIVASTIALDGEIDKGNNGTWSKIDGIWPGYSIFQGFGALQLGRVLRFDDSNFNLYVDDVWPGEAGNGGRGLDSGDSIGYCLEVTGNERDLRVVVAWDDFPAMTTASGSVKRGEVPAPVLVNNLDLKTGFSDANITTDDLGMAGGNFKTRRDERNTIEHTITSRSLLKMGSQFFVNITGAAVPRGPQPYAVVIVGQFNNVRKNCKTPFTQVLEAATDQDYFPYGAIVGGSIAGVLLMVIMAIVKAYMNKTK